jgi:hypothetical protein
MSTTETLLDLKVHKLSNESYESKKDAGSLDDSALYLTPEQPLIIKLTEGATTEGTDLFTYDGSEEKVVTIPDTKVTSAANHYTPTADTNAALGGTATGATSNATWGSTCLVTGVSLQRDNKGHVTNLTVDSVKMPTQPNTNTTYDLSAPANKSNGSVTLDLKAGGSGSGTDSVTIKGDGDTTVTTDASGNIIISSTDNNTHYTASMHAGAASSTSNSTSAVTDPYLILRENSTNRSQIKIQGTGRTTVTANGGVITINSTAPSSTSCEGKVKIGSTWYTCRTGTSGSASYITFNI